MDAKMKQEVQKEVDEEFDKYLKDHKKNRKDRYINWYKVLAIFIMSTSILLTILCIYVVITS